MTRGKKEGAVGKKANSFIEQARKKQILEAASVIFREKGFTNTSLDDIAKSVGVSRGVLFYYFDGKREIGENTVRESLHHYSEYVRSRMEKKRSAKTRLLEFIDACIDYQVDHPEVYIEYIELVGCLGDDEDKYRLTKSVNKRTRAMLIQLIEQGKAEGELALVDSQALADTIQAFVDGMMEMTAMEPGAVDTEQCKKLIRRMLLSLVKTQ